MSCYLVVIEHSEGAFGAFVPDLPGCVAVAKSTRQVRRLIREAIDLHLLDMRERGERIPRPTARIDYVPVHNGRRRRAA